MLNSVLITDSKLKSLSLKLLTIFHGSNEFKIKSVLDTILKSNFKIHHIGPGRFEDYKKMGKFIIDNNLLTKINNLLPLIIDSNFTITIKENEVRDNCGFELSNGVKAIMPIIVKLFSANKNELIVIEYPDLSLHGHSQSALTKFIALFIKSGIQIFIKTHSDHIINGFRVVIKQQEIPINPEDAIIYHCDHTDEDFIPILIDSRGRCSQNPHGFMDQWDKDIESLLGW